MKTEVSIDILQSNRRILKRNGCNITVNKGVYLHDIKEDTVCIKLDDDVVFYLDFEELKKAIKKLED